MAVDNDNEKRSAESQDGPMLRFKGRQWIVGANVTVMVALAAAVLVFANYLAFNFNKKSDWTSSGINSLGEQSEKLMSGLETKVTLTSLYRTFQDPAFEGEAKKFRTAMDDILQLYQAEAPAHVDVETINPAKDREKVLGLIDRLRKKTAYQGEAKKHRALIDAFTNELAPSMLKLLQDEAEKLQGFSQTNAGLKDIREYSIITRNCQLLARQTNAVQENVGALLSDELPKYSSAVDAIKGVYEQVKSALNDGAGWMQHVDTWTKQNKVDPPADVAFFKSASKRYKPFIDKMDAELDKAKDLPTLKLEELDRDVRPDSIIIETDEEARVLSFEDVWPAKQRGQFGQPVGGQFKDRRCAAEVEISSAVLQLTQKTKSAVVFVRFGGRPLFFGGMMMGGGQAQYGGAKDRLEKANFIVKEWDLSTKKEPPEFEDNEKPGRIIWVLLKPEQAQPPPGMPPQMRQRPRTFGPQERQAVEAALGDDPRILFVAGWVQPPGNPMMMGPPPGYEYNDWLKKEWGIEVQFNYPVLEAFSSEPGKMAFRRNPFGVTRHSFSSHPIVEPLRSLKGEFPQAAPIKREDKVPDGVSLEDLVTVPDRDDIWAESDLQGLSRDYQKNHYTNKGKMDISGPFPIAAAATRTRDGKPAGKIVVVSSRGFALDAVALSRALVPQGDRFTLVLNNPANMDMLVNTVHWLNDNEGLIGKGIESRDMPRLDALEEGSAGLRVAQTLSVVVWPAIALLAGLAVWFVRRR